MADGLQLEEEHCGNLLTLLVALSVLEHTLLLLEEPTCRRWDVESVTQLLAALVLVVELPSATSGGTIFPLRAIS